MPVRTLPLRYDRVVASSPEATLAAIRSVGEWRESQMPEAQRRHGLLALEFSASGGKFEATFYSRNRDYEPPYLRGRVLPHAEGARVTARIGRTGWSFVPGALFASLWIWPVVTGQDRQELLIVVALGCAFVGLVHYLGFSNRAQRDATMLAERFENVLDTLPTAGATDGATTSPPAP